MADLSYELNFLEAAVSELKNYLLSDEVYWNLGVRAPGGGRPYPQFSLGWLLVFRRRLVVDQDPTTLSVLAQIADVEAQWQSAWARKAVKEYEIRLKLWTQFMSELRQSPATNRDRYAYEVQRRTMLDLLAETAVDLPDELVSLLRVTDAALRRMVRPGGFIEDASYQREFPEERFWYLYGTIR